MHLANHYMIHSVAAEPLIQSAVYDLTEASFQRSPPSDCALTTG